MEIKEVKFSKNDILLYEYDYGLIYLKYLDDNKQIDPKELCLSQKTINEIYKLGDIYGKILNLEEIDPNKMIGYNNIQEVKYYLYYKLYVATLINCEYKEGEVFIYKFDINYGNEQSNESICNIYQFIKHLSELNDLDLKTWIKR